MRRYIERSEYTEDVENTIAAVAEENKRQGVKALVTTFIALGGICLGAFFLVNLMRMAAL